jgi:hypothetical protein
MSNFCRNFQTHDYVGSSTSSVAVGVLSFIVVLLALLIVLMGVGIVVYPRYIKPRFKDYQQKYKSASPKRQPSMYTVKATPVKGSQKPGTLNRAIAARGAGDAHNLPPKPYRKSKATIDSAPSKEEYEVMENREEGYETMKPAEPTKFYNRTIIF